MVGRGEDDRAAGTAAAWYARHARGEGAAAPRFRRWHSARPAHERAWRRVQAADTVMEGLAREPEIVLLIEQARRSRRRTPPGALWLGATLSALGGSLLIGYGAIHFAGMRLHLGLAASRGA